MIQVSLSLPKLTLTPALNSNKTVDNRLPSVTTSQQQIALLLVALIVAIAGAVAVFYWLQTPDPYTQQVLSLQGDPVRGEAMFQINCAGCHGRDADGNVGPSLRHVAQRKSDWGLIHQVTSGDTPPMPKFQPTPQDMADLLRYLEQL